MLSVPLQRCHLCHTAVSWFSFNRWCCSWPVKREKRKRKNKNIVNSYFLNDFVKHWFVNSLLEPGSWWNPKYWTTTRSYDRQCLVSSYTSQIPTFPLRTTVYLHIHLPVHEPLTLKPNLNPDFNPNPSPNPTSLNLIIINNYRHFYSAVYLEILFRGALIITPVLA